MCVVCVVFLCGYPDDSSEAEPETKPVGTASSNFVGTVKKSLDKVIATKRKGE